VCCIDQFLAWWLYSLGGGGEAASRKTNPRVLHSNTYAASGFSYVDVVKATMERGNFGGNDNMGGNGQRPGGGPSSF
jgi:hypothetical protein